jgi:hypothetical protein
MAQNIGINAPTRIPTFGDDASIEEALRKYHYGIDQWDGDPVQDNLGVDGNFRTVKSRLTSLENIVGSSGNFILRVSQTASPNVITGQTTATVPLTVGGITGQTANLQVWQNIIGSVNTNVAIVFPSGAASFRRYLTVGDTTQSTTTGINLTINSASDRGIVVRAATSQSANLQEWQNSSGTPISWVNNEGKFFYNGQEVIGGGEGRFDPFFLSGM